MTCKTACVSPSVVAIIISKLAFKSNLTRIKYQCTCNKDGFDFRKRFVKLFIRILATSGTNVSPPSEFINASVISRRFNPPRRLRRDERERERERGEGKEHSRDRGRRDSAKLYCLRNEGATGPCATNTNSEPAGSASLQRA